MREPIRMGSQRSADVAAPAGNALLGVTSGEYAIGASDLALEPGTELGSGERGSEFRAVEPYEVDAVLHPRLRESRPAEDSLPEHQVGAWTDCSDAYESFAAGITRSFARDAARLVRISAGCMVLDVAAGTGEFAFAAAERGARVLATDFSPSMLALLEKCRHRLGIEGVDTALMDGQALALDDGTYDVAGSLFGLVFFPDQMRGLRELYRVLKPGGQVVVANWAPPARVELMRLVGEAMMVSCPDLPELEVPSARHWTRLSDHRVLRQLLLDAGFGAVHVVELTHVWTFDEVADFAGALPRMTPGWRELEARMTGQQKQRFRKTLVESFRQRQGEGPFAVTAQGMIAVGSKPPS